MIWFKSNPSRIDNSTMYNRPSNPAQSTQGPTLVNGPQPQQQTNAYLRTRVLSATPEELRLLLLDGAIKFGTQGVEGMERKDYEAMYNGISQCRNIVFELMTTIRTDVNPEVSTKVQSLFLFMYKELMEGSHERDPQRIRKVIELLEYERETWVLLMQKLAEERSGHVADSPLPPSDDRAPRPISMNA